MAIEYPDFESKGTPPCQEVYPDIFFPEPDDPNKTYLTREAKKICSTCPYAIECLRWALENNEMGIWGGTTESERKQLRRGIPLRVAPPKRWSGKE